MAIKVVYKDTKKIDMAKIDNTYYKTTCHNCSSIFVYQSKDINLILKDRLKDNITVIKGRGIRCPVCKNICMIENNMFTKEITKTEYESYGG